MQTAAEEAEVNFAYTFSAAKKREKCFRASTPCYDAFKATVVGKLTREITSRVQCFRVKVDNAIRLHFQQGGLKMKIYADP